MSENLSPNATGHGAGADEDYEPTGEDQVSELLETLDDAEAEQRAASLRAGLEDYELDEEDAALLARQDEEYEDETEGRLNPVLAIVGRPNVGKSTLVNRILGRREAVVEDTPGVTRDRVSYPAQWTGHNFTLVDTGGWEQDAKGINARVADQAEIAVDMADAVLLVDALDLAPNLLPQDPGQGNRLRPHHVDLEPAMTEGGRRLQADEAGAQDHRALRRRRGRDDGAAVIEGPQHVHVRPVVTRDSEAPGFGTLAVRVQPAGASILVDGERWEGSDTSGERLLVQLAEGRHRVEVQREGYQPYATDVDVRSGETATLNVSLPQERQ